MALKYYFFRTEKRDDVKSFDKKTQPRCDKILSMRRIDLNVILNFCLNKIEKDLS